MLFIDHSKINSVTYQEFDSLNRIIASEEWSYKNNRKDYFLSKKRYEYPNSGVIICYSDFYLNTSTDTLYYKLAPIGYTNPLDPNAKYSRIYCNRKKIKEGNSDSLKCFDSNEKSFSLKERVFSIVKYNIDFKDIMELKRAFVSLFDTLPIRDSEIEIKTGDEKIHLYYYNELKQIKKIKTYWQYNWERQASLDYYMEVKYKY